LGRARVVEARRERMERRVEVRMMNKSRIEVELDEGR
jgi:hypothetical protein